MEYISLQGYIRNIPLDKEDLAKHQLRVCSSLTTGKEYIEPSKTQ